MKCVWTYFVLLFPSNKIYRKGVDISLGSSPLHFFYLDLYANMGNLHRSKLISLVSYLLQFEHLVDDCIVCLSCGYWLWIVTDLNFQLPICSKLEFLTDATVMVSENWRAWKLYWWKFKRYSIKVMVDLLLSVFICQLIFWLLKSNVRHYRKERCP